MADNIIAISGKQFSGKDTVAKILLKSLTNFKRVGIGDTIKLEYSRRTGLSLEEIELNKPKYRPDLIALGDWGRNQDNDFWLKYVLKQPGNIIVTDVRVVHELEIFKSNGAFLLRVESLEEERKKRGILVSANDATETQLDNIKYWDYIINNNGSYEELVSNTEILLNFIRNKFNKTI